MNTVVYHVLNPPIRARYIRVSPVDWHLWISMRMELYGCQGNERGSFQRLSQDVLPPKSNAIHACICHLSCHLMVLIYQPRLLGFPLNSDLQENEVLII